VADALEIAFRRLARTSPTVVVGEEMRSRWAAAAPQLLATSFALVNDDDLVPVDEAGARPWHTPALALSVGRIDREKNPLLLADLVADLGPSWQLDVAGAGPLHDDLARRGNELGVGDRLNLLGLVPFGPELHRLYRAADVFVHVSLTEAVPQVLYEAMAAGTPIVATDVGGVGAALGHGTRGVLVPPRDPEALANAMRSLAADPATCLRLAQAARAEATRETLQAQADRILTFFATSGR
jgi:glycosyltransferase involved in cell wall biosynthesis